MKCERLVGFVKSKYQHSQLNIENSFLVDKKWKWWKRGSILLNMLSASLTNDLDILAPGRGYLRLFLWHSWFREWQRVSINQNISWLDVWVDIRDSVHDLAAIIELHWLKEWICLNFWRARMNAESVGVICRAIQKHWLKANMTISFHDDHIWVAWIKHIADMLKQTWLQEWVTLNLENCMIDDEWMMYLADALWEVWLKENVTLKLWCNPIRREWMMYFISALEKVGLKKGVKIDFINVWDVSLNYCTYPKPRIRVKDVIATHRWVEFIAMLERIWLQEDVEIRLRSVWQENAISKKFYSILNNVSWKRWFRLEVWTGTLGSPEIWTKIRKLIEEKETELSK